MSEYSILSQIPVVLDEVQGYPLADLLAMKEHANKCGNEATNQQEKVMWNKRMTFISSEIDRRYRNVDKISDFVSGFGYDYTTFIKEEKIMSDKVEEEISHDQLRDVKGLSQMSDPALFWGFTRFLEVLNVHMINGNVELSYRLGVRTVQFVRELRKRGVFV